MSLRLESVRAGYGRNCVVDGITFEIPSRRTLAVVGPSGAGKTTLLRAVAGLVPLQSGDVSLDGESVGQLAPQRRRIAFVFQHDALVPTMSVRDNLRLALRDRRKGDGIDSTATAMRFEAHLDRKPHQLSGGERQRASLARALISDPKALLLDEPLAHLDPALRRSVREVVLGVRERFEGPILYVTHDHAEAMTAGDEIAVLIDGAIQDCGDPQRVYERPRNVGVARFLGDRPMNLLDGETIGIRPEHVRLGNGGSLHGRVRLREATGADAYVHLETERGEIVARVRASDPGAVGDRLSIEFPEEFVRRFEPATGMALA